MGRVVIVGGGLTGLTTAYYIARAGRQVTVLESGSRFGGWIRTSHNSDLNCMFEAGPRAFVSRRGELTLKLIHDLGIHDDIVDPDPASARRFLYNDKGKYPLPRTMFEVLTSRVGFRLSKALVHDILSARREDVEDETILSFFSRRLGDKAAHEFVYPLVAGIYAGDPSQLSMRSCFKFLWDQEDEHRSLIMASMRSPSPAVYPHSLYSLKEGMEQLPLTLVKNLQELGADLQLACTVNSITHDGVVSYSQDGRTHSIVPDHVVCTAPTFACARMLEEFTPNLAELLRRIDYTSINVVNYGFRSKVYDDANNKGFGVLVHSDVGSPVLGISFDSHIFNSHPGSGTRMTVMISGYHTDIQELALSETRKLLRSPGLPIPDLTLVNYQNNCIAQPRPGHHIIVEEIERGTPPNISLISSGLYGVSMNDCIRTAVSTAYKLS